MYSDLVVSLFAFYSNGPFEHTHTLFTYGVIVLTSPLSLSLFLFLLTSLFSLTRALED